MRKYSELLSEDQQDQTGYVKWLIEQAICQDYESHILRGFAQEIEELIPLAVYPKVRAQLIKGWKLAEFGEVWFSKEIPIDTWIGWFYCDRVYRKPLGLPDMGREVVIIDSVEIAQASARLRYKDGEV